MVWPRAMKNAADDDKEDDMKCIPMNGNKEDPKQDEKIICERI